MSTQNNTFKTSEEYIKNSSKLFSESAIAAADVYNKQFKFGYDLYSNFINMGFNTLQEKPIFSSDLFHSNFEMLKDSINNISKLSEKTISTIMNAYNKQDYKSVEENKMNDITDAIIEAYHLQAKQIGETNSRFFNAFGRTFQKTNENMEKSYSLFRKNSEENFHKVEEAINSAIKKYSSSINKSDKTRQELFDNINNQMELLVKSNLKQWSDLTKTIEQEHKTPEEKVKRKETVINN